MKFFKNLVVFIIGGVSLIYLINPGSGIIEMIPDNFPFIGNLDEAAATTLFLASMNYFGVNLSSIFGKCDCDPSDVIDV